MKNTPQETHQFLRLSEYNATEEAETMTHELGGKPPASDYELFSRAVDAEKRNRLGGSTIGELKDLRNNLSFTIDHLDEVKDVIRDKMATLPDIFNKLQSKSEKGQVNGVKLSTHLFLSFSDAEKYPFIKVNKVNNESKHASFNNVIGTYLRNQEFKSVEEVEEKLQSALNNLPSEQEKVEEVIEEYDSSEMQEADKEAIAQWKKRKAEIKDAKTLNLFQKEKELREKPYEIPRNFFFKGTLGSSKAGFYYINPNTMKDDELIVQGTDRNRKKMNWREFDKASTKTLEGSKFFEKLQIVPDRKFYLDRESANKSEKQDKKTIIDKLKEMLDQLNQMNREYLKSKGPEFEKHLSHAPLHVFKDLLFKVFYPGRNNRAYAELVGVISKMAQSKFYYTVAASGAWGPGPIRSSITTDRMIQNALDNEIEKEEYLDALDPDELLQFKADCRKDLEQQFQQLNTPATECTKKLEILEKQLEQIPCCKYRDLVLIKKDDRYNDVLELLNEEQKEKVIRI